MTRLCVSDHVSTIMLLVRWISVAAWKAKASEGEKKGNSSERERERGDKGEISLKHHKHTDSVDLM